MQIYLPIAEMAVNAEEILALGGVVGFLSGIFGIGGGFLITPLLIFMGIPPAVAVGTQSAQLVAGSTTGTVGHWRKGNVDIKIGGMMILGSVFGSLIGAFLFKFLQKLGQIDLAISLLYILLLGSIGILMAVDLAKIKPKKKNDEDEGQTSSRFTRMVAKWPYKMHFPKSKLYVSAFLPMTIGFAGGFLVTLIGVGGGFVLVPAMIYLLRMSPLMVAGTSLFQILFSSTFSTLAHATANQTVDFVLALSLTIGTVLGTQIGVGFARRIKGSWGRAILAFMLLVMAGSLLMDLLLEPASLYSLSKLS